MKTKKLFFVFFVMSFFPYIIYAQPDSGDSDSQFELYLHNLTSESITAVVYPAGMVFNGTDPPSYNPIATNRLFYQTGNQTKVIDYVLGSRYHLYQVPPYNYTGRTNIFQIQPNSFLGLNYDKWNAPMTNDADGIFGRGIYKIVYKWNTDHDMDSVLFEQDAGDNWDTRIFIVDDRSLYGGPPSRGLVYQSFIDNHGTWGP